MSVKSGLIFVSIKAISGQEILKRLVSEVRNISWNFQFSSVYRQFETEQRYDFDANFVTVIKIGVEVSAKELGEKVQHLQTYLESFTGKGRVKTMLLAFDQETRMTPELTLPHPMLHLDPLVTRCAAEVWGTFGHPILNLSLNELARKAPPILDAEFMLQGKSLVLP